MGGGWDLCFPNKRSACVPGPSGSGCLSGGSQDKKHAGLTLEGDGFLCLRDCREPLLRCAPGTCLTSVRWRPARSLHLPGLHPVLGEARSLQDWAAVASGLHTLPSDPWRVERGCVRGPHAPVQRVSSFPALCLRLGTQKREGSRMGCRVCGELACPQPLF